jgi:dienelactone hydrolase
VFDVYKDQFSYDRRELNPRVELRDESSEDWIQEKVIVDAAYGHEKLPLYLFLPRRSRPPYQVVIYFPGSGSFQRRSSKDLEHYSEFRFLSSIVRNGRAGVYPVYKGTFERGEDYPGAISSGASTRENTEYVIQLVKDFRTSIDYLESRRDIDTKKLAYLGYSWGGQLGPIVLASEPRVQADILIVGGMVQAGRPEVQQINYVSRVTTPTLMLNGRYDMVFPYLVSAKPMFELLGTPRDHKRQVVYESDDFVPYNELVKETLAWLDRDLGPVK